MANRFNQLLNKPEYVETYVPLPLDLIAQQGAQKQQDLDLHKKALEADTDPLAKIGDLSFSLKVYDGKGNRIDKTNNSLEQYKNQTIQQLAAEREQLANDLATGKLSDVDFKTKSANHIKNATNAYNQLAGYKSNATAIQKANEEYAKSKSFGASPYYGTDMVDYNTKYMQNAEKGVFNPYNQQAIAEDFDIQTALDNFKFKEEGVEWNSIGDYITHGGKKGVDPKRVQNAAARLFRDPTSKVYQYAKLALTDDMRLNPENYKTQKDVDQAWNDKQQDFIKGSVERHAGWVKSEDIKGDPYAEMRAKDKLEHPQFTLFNESVVTPGEKVDYKKVSDNIDNINSQLAQLPKPGSANDNYETQSARKALDKQLKIANNYLNTATQKYYNTEEGRKQLSNEFKQGINKKDVLGLDYDGIGKVLNDPEVKKYIKNENDYIDFMTGKKVIPEELLNKQFDSTRGSIGGSGSSTSTMTLKKYLTTGLNEKVSEYIDKNPIAYSSKVLTGNENSTVGKVNKELTERVSKNGTNYYTVDGIDLNSWKAKNLEEGDKLEVAVMDDDLDGQFAHYMTIKTKDGVIKSEMPIYPKDGGREEQGYIGRKMLEENKSQSDPLEKSNYQRGARMLANATYGEQVDEQLLKSYIPRLENNSGKSYSVPVNLTINGGEFNGKIKMKKDDNVVTYELQNERGESIMKNNKPVNSIDDLKVSLLGL